MAWVTEYDMTWHSQEFAGGVLLQRDGGTYQMPLLLKRGSLIIQDSLPSWEDPIVRMNCSFTIVNDQSDFYALMPLMTISQGQIKVIVYITYPSLGDVTIFEGHLNCEAVSQSMVNGADIHLTASGLVNKLQWDAPESIYTVQDMSLIDVIADCLAMTGSEYDIRVWCPLYERSAPLGSGDSLFNLVGVSTELFWENNIDKLSALDILRWILSSLNCFLYWHREVWCIVHYEVLGSLSEPYVQYTFGSSYDYDNPGTSYGPYNREQKDVHSPETMPQVFGTQVLAASPGFKQVDVSLEQLQYFNQLNGDLSDVEESNTSPVWVSLRSWHALFGGWDSTWQGYPAGGISNALGRVGSYDITSQDGVLNGLTTHFKVTVADDTQLTIKWKIYVRNAFVPYGDHFWAASEDMEVVFHWFLQLAYGDYIRYDEDTDTWIKHAVRVPNTLTIRGTDFDPKLRMYEGQFVIPLGEVYDASTSDSVDLSLIFRMGTETVTDEGDDLTWTDEPMNWVYYGDFHAATDAAPEDNLLEGTVTTDFLDQKTVDMYVFDGGWNYRNSLKLKGIEFGAIGTGAYIGWYNLTKSWSYDGSNFDTLARKLLESKYRLYRIARQKITVRYNTPSPVVYEEWTPLSLFYDNKQSNKKFIVASQSRKLDDDTILVELWEYDDTETINLV